MISDELISVKGAVPLVALSVLDPPSNQFDTFQFGLLIGCTVGHVRLI